MRDETFSEAMSRLRQDAKLLGAHHITAGLDQLQARVDDERDVRLRDAFARTEEEQCRDKTPST